MKKNKIQLLLCMMLLATSHSYKSEDIFVKSKPAKKESMQQIKMQLVQDYETLITTSTRTIKQLSDVIDTAVSNIKQLAGEGSGELLTADKKALKLYGQKAEELQELLVQVCEQCSLTA